MENEPTGAIGASGDVAGGVPAQPKPRRRAFAWSSLALLVAAVGGAAVLGVATQGPTVPGADMAPADFVVSSAHDTLAQHTADIVITGSIDAAGKTVPVTGSGQADFAANAVSANISAAVQGSSLSEQELAVNGNVYLAMTIDGIDMSRLTGGAQWVSIPVPDQSGSSAPGVSTGDPLTELHIIEQKGATVVPLGTSVIDGDTVSGYSITPSATEIHTAIEHEIASGEIPASAGQQVLNTAQSLSLSADVWFDASGLLRRETVTLGLGSLGVSGKVDFTFQNYGTPVSIAAPAPSDVIGYSQFVQDLQSFQGTTD